MKKIIILSLIALSYGNSSIYAGVLDGGYKIGCKITGSEKKYSWPANPKDPKSTTVGFSLNNKSNDQVFVTVENSSIGKPSTFDRFMKWALGTTTVYRVPKNSVLDLDLDTSKETTLTFYNCTNLESCDPSSTKNKGPSFGFIRNKTMYVNWDGKRLYPQRGPYFGWAYVTDGCYTLDNNVLDTQKDIIKK